MIKEIRKDTDELVYEAEVKMKEIWIVEYCDINCDLQFTLKGAFATRELAEKYIDKQPYYSDLYRISKTFYCENEEGE